MKGFKMVESLKQVMRCDLCNKEYSLDSIPGSYAHLVVSNKKCFNLDICSECTKVLHDRMVEIDACRNVNEGRNCGLVPLVL
jgi:hypothetical protein